MPPCNQNRDKFLITRAAFENRFSKAAARNARFVKRYFQYSQIIFTDVLCGDLPGWELRETSSPNVDGVGQGAARYNTIIVLLIMKFTLGVIQ